MITIRSSLRRVARSGTAACLTFGLLALWMTGCGTTHQAAHTDAGGMPPDGYDAGLLEQQLRDTEQEWHGAPYRWGGTSRNGIDCSGFVTTVYRDLFDLSLPRTTEALAQTGRPVASGALQTGDLIFFRTSTKTRHVGIYLGAGDFAHASTSLGVTTSRLDDSYWQRTYWTARRILPTHAAVASVPASATPATTRAPARRTGW